MNSLSKVWVERIFWQGTKCTCLENKSDITQITVFSKPSGNSTIQSIDISFRGAFGSATDWRSPVSSLVSIWQRHRQDSWLCSFLCPFWGDGHQNCRLTRCRVFTNPKCPATFESWLCCRTNNWWLPGTYSFALTYARPFCSVHSFLSTWYHLSPPKAALIVLFRSSVSWAFTFVCAWVVTGAAICLERMTSLITPGFELLYYSSLDRASARKFFPPGK